MPAPDITSLLHDWVEGDAQSLNTLTPLVYEQLHRIAKNAFRGEQAGHTLQATALVHEAFAKLVDVDVDWRDRTHFYALSARLMRRILVDHAKARNAEKRGGGVRKLSLDEALVVSPESDEHVIELHEALNELGKRDPRKAEILELHYFGGLTYEEMATVLDLSSSTLDRDMRFAKAWLKTELGNGG